MSFKLAEPLQRRYIISEIKMIKLLFSGVVKFHINLYCAHIARFKIYPRYIGTYFLQHPQWEYFH